ncbi:MAG: uroporphyrinogen-III synthase [Candidatus Nitrosocosmicus sp.]|nr:uroporphyrinogen-III synthase [Candidatus Nitrosocosmicus sp.]MDN5866429.1 uroporphyrinogen-III synthase [Candidatus Nitrosocosmicus sp.]
MEKIIIVITNEGVLMDDLPNQNIDQAHLNMIEIIALPTIFFNKIDSQEVRESFKRLSSGFYDYCIFLSSNAVKIFFEIAKNEYNYERIMEELNKINIIVIGPKTKKTLQGYGFEPMLGSSTNIIDKIIDKKYSSSEIIEFLENLERECKSEYQKEIPKILMPRSAESIKSNNYIDTKFKYIILDQVFLYETRENKNVSNSVEWKKLLELPNRDEKTFLIFTSPSTVRSFFKIIYHQFSQLSESKNEREVLQALKVNKVISIGPKTSLELKKNKIDFMESSEYTINGALESLLRLIK